MSQITIDLNDSPELLGEIAAFLQRLSDGPMLVEVTTPPPPLPVVDETDFDGQHESKIPSSDGGNMAPPEPSALEGVEFDSAGVPWDHRIHGSAKKKLGNGNWKRIRGVAPEIVEKVEAELQAVMDIPTPVDEIADNLRKAIDHTGNMLVDSIPDIYGTETVVEAPTDPTPPAPTVTPPAPTPVDDKMTFPELMSAITSAGIPPESVTAAVVKCGLQALPLLAARPDLIPMVAAELGL